MTLAVASGLGLLFDENLSPRLIDMLATEFPASQHVDTVGLHGRPDREIWQAAGDLGLVLVSKDNDFRQLSFLYGAPPKVIWLHVGNATTKAIAALLRARRTQIAAFVADPETALLVLEPLAASVSAVENLL